MWACKKLYADSHKCTVTTMIKFLCIHLLYSAAVCKNKFIQRFPDKIAKLANALYLLLFIEIKFKKCHQKLKML